MQKNIQLDFNAMIQTTINLLKKYDITFNNSCRKFVDGANPSFIRALKDRVSEVSDYEQEVSFYKQNYPSVYDLQFLQQNMCSIFYGYSSESSSPPPSRRFQDNKYCTVIKIDLINRR
jgi:hypothetical protein